MKSFFMKIIDAQCKEHEKEWIYSKINTLEETSESKQLFLAFSAVPRFVRKVPVSWNASLSKEAESLRKGFDPSRWFLDQTVRVLFVTSFKAENADHFVNTVERIFDTADMRELSALYSALPVLPWQKRFVERAAEGVRTNMTHVFDAIALNNPYPFDYFPQNAWNQMVLKAAFMDRPIYRIYGVDKRSNSELSRIVSDYAHERWAAGRVVSPELWRPVGNKINEAIRRDVDKLFSEEDILQQQAAALLCADSEDPELLDKLEEHPQLKSAVDQENITWDSVGKEWWKRKE